MATDSRIDGVLASLAVKAPCVAVAIANITLSGEQTVNGVAVVTDDRVLVTAQTAGKDNGIYDVKTSAWTRAPDMDSNRDLTAGTLFVVSTTPLVGFYQLTNTGTITLDTTALTFAQVTDADIAGNLVGLSAGQGAVLVGLRDTAGYLAADDVEAAIAEIFNASSGTFVPNFNVGYSSGPTNPLFTWSIYRNIVTLSMVMTFTGTVSDVTTLQVDNLPSAIQPDSPRTILIGGLHNNSVNVAEYGSIVISSSASTITFGLGGDNIGGGGFTAAGTKGLFATVAVSYQLKDAV